MQKMNLNFDGLLFSFVGDTTKAIFLNHPTKFKKEKTPKIEKAEI